MKKGKAAGPTGIVSEMFMSDKDCSVDWLTSLCDLITAEGSSVAKWFGRRNCDQQVAGSNPGLPAIKCNPGQVNTHVPLSPSSIIWYQPMALCLSR